jgi:hypothetical protein
VVAPRSKPLTRAFRFSRARRRGRGPRWPARGMPRGRSRSSAR